MGGSLQPAGEAARQIAGMWWAMFWLGTAAFVVFLVLLAAGLLRRRHHTDEEAASRLREGGTDRPSRAWIVGGGVVQPLLLVIVVFALTLLAMRAIPDSAGEDALRIDITSHQWWYEVTYPDLEVTTANQMYIPVGQPVKLTLRSADVIHSFWVPQLAGKLDMLPDGPSTLVIQADEAGEYQGLCAEFCGIQHTRMGFVAVAVEGEVFDSWVQQQAEPAVEPTDDTAARGQEVFVQANCMQCHTIEGADFDAPFTDTEGPVLTHFASRASIGAGTTDNTAEDLASWITDPHAVKEGVKMPATDLDADELEALVTYLQGLQ
ncbi:cytochrome c oxidase subunit II [soil metagenome]